MASKVAIVKSSVGLHARPAAIVAAEAGKYDEEITLTLPGGSPIDASSVLMIMTLGAACGSEVTVESENREAVDAIAALIEKDLDAA